MPVVTMRSLSALVLVFFTGIAQADESGWLAGTAKSVITPEQPIWMAGYGGRDHPAEGALHDLCIRVLALKDRSGHVGIVLSSDTLGIPQSIYNRTCVSLKENYDLDPDQIMLHASHTHCGPVLRGALYDVYPLDDKQKQLIDAYSTRLERTIVETIGRALDQLEPASVSAGRGIATFAVNRRNNLEPDVPTIRRTGKLSGPVDHSVPVLAVRKPDGSLIAVVFGYACHNTTLSFYQWCGDYAGFAQYALEDVHPDAVALFFSGCGADQNPLPRRTVELAKGYGLHLAGAVERVLAESMDQLPPVLQTDLEMVQLNLGAQPTREQLADMADGKPNYITRWASRLLKDLDSGKTLERTYPYPLQAWKLGRKQLWMTMGGEVVVDYSLGFRERFGDDTWVAGYCNDVMAYIPSLRVLDEDVPPRKSSRWGYEGNRSMIVYGRGAERWADDIEELITNAADRLVARLNAQPKPEL